MEDALDAPQRLLTPRGDAVKGFVIVLQRATAFSEGRGKIGDLPHCSFMLWNQKFYLQGTVVHTCNLSIREAEAGGWQVCVKTQLLMSALSQKETSPRSLTCMKEMEVLLERRQIFNGSCFPSS